MQSRVSPFSQSQLRPDFIGNLRPILVWLRMIGVELAPSVSTTKLQRYGTVFFGLLVLILNIATNTYSLTTFYNLSDNQTEKVDGSKFQSWSMSFGYIQSTVTGSATHLSLFFVSIFKWKSMCDCLQKMERVMNLEHCFYRKLNWRVKFGCVLIILVRLVRISPRYLLCYPTRKLCRK